MPWDGLLGLDGSRQTPAAREVISLAGTTNAFRDGGWQIKKLSGLDVSESTILRTTEAAGGELAQALDQGAPIEHEENWDWACDARGRRCGYASVDGIHVPMQGPGGKHAETRVEYVGRLYNHRGGAAAPEETPGLDTRYVAGFHSLDETCGHLFQHLQQVGGEQVQEWICITDGGAGIAEALKRTFCWTTWILDFWHAKEYLLEFAKTLFADDETSREAWLSSWCHALKHEGGSVVLARLRALDQAAWSAAAREAWCTLTRYYENQLEGMDYPSYVANGWQIGSGPVEAACKTVVATRLKRSGMRWKERGANTVSHLRALYLNGEAAWNAYWAWRQHPPATLRIAA